MYRALGVGIQRSPGEFFSKSQIGKQKMTTPRYPRCKMKMPKMSRKHVKAINLGSAKPPKPKWRGEKTTWAWRFLRGGIPGGGNVMRWMKFFDHLERLSLDFWEFSNIPQTQNQQFVKEFLSFGGLVRPGVCSRGYVGVLLGWNLSSFHQSHKGIRRVPPFHQCHGRWGRRY